ncbi:MAG TPA: alpha/beta hydrolase [Solirubrobacteraceae bacterium]|jgi:pimeloyl-ACP methyl ester carboxylesterase|nr:alpha/beta hydrolase [Solirubrobacteraceae bacterium]
MGASQTLESQEHYGPLGRSAWLDVDWRTHQRWVTVGSDAVNVIDLGEGPPLVFVHGLSGSWQNWLEQLPEFAARHRVIALDLPGFGHSPMPAQPISISGYARLLDGLLDKLDVAGAAVVGNSMGGFISAELAIAFPERVERLVLVSAAGLSTYANPGAARALPTLRQLERIVMACTAWTASRADVVARRPRLRDLTLNVVALHPGRLPSALAAEQIRGGGKPGFLGALEAILNYDFRHRLPEIACPTLIVWGERDRLITVRDADLFAELIPNSRKVLFEETGHVAMLERPAKFNALLESFLGE